MNVATGPSREDARTPPRISMPRFVAIDGLRAWMAWVVVLSHVAQQGLPPVGIAMLNRLDPGGQAVDVFIVISGFVITHLLLERPGPYMSYIIPRFMRLFPAFLVCCLIGQVSYWVARQIGSDEWFVPLHGPEYRALIRDYPAHVVAHLTMLHGAIPNSILPYSQYAFDPPGWSVSLEWQFYLIAPAVVWLAKSRDRAVFLVVAVIACTILYHDLLKPFWDRPSFIVGTAKMFLIGIACRFASPALAGRITYVAPIGIGLCFTMLWIGSFSMAIWATVFTFILRTDQPLGRIDHLYTRVLRSVLESAPVHALAERSYSTYLLHWPILTLIGAIATANGVSPGPRLALLMLLVIPLTLLFQEPIYRFVEVPGRALGKRWAAKYGARPIREQPSELVSIQS